MNDILTVIQKIKRSNNVLFRKTDNRNRVWDLIDHVYREIFYPDGFTEPGYRSSDVYEIYTHIKRLNKKIIVGYFIISPKSIDNEGYLDILLEPKYRGLGLMKHIIPDFKKYIGKESKYDYLYSWTRYDKVSNILENCGFTFVRDDEDNKEYMLTIHNI